MWQPTPCTKAILWRIGSYDLPIVLYAGLIFWLSARSFSPDQQRWLQLFPDKLFHGLEYGVLAVLAFRQWWHSGRIRSPWLALLLSLGISAGYAATDEWHQFYVPGRRMDFRDWLADGVGAVVFLAIWLGYLLKKKKLTP